MNIEALRLYAIEKIKENDGSNSRIDFFNIMFRGGVIDKHRLLKACINDSFNDKLNKSKGTKYTSRDLVFEVAIDFDVSISTVNNTIYLYRDVQLIF